MNREEVTFGPEEAEKAEAFEKRMAQLGGTGKAIKGASKEFGKPSMSSPMTLEPELKDIGSNWNKLEPELAEIGRPKLPPEPPGYLRTIGAGAIHGLGDYPELAADVGELFGAEMPSMRGAEKSLKNTLLSQEEVQGLDIPHKIAYGVGQALPTIPQYLGPAAGITRGAKALGMAPRVARAAGNILGFGGIEALKASPEGPGRALERGLEGAVTGGILEALHPLSRLKRAAGMAGTFGGQSFIENMRQGLPAGPAAREAIPSTVIGAGMGLMGGRGKETAPTGVEAPAPPATPGQRRLGAGPDIRGLLPPAPEEILGGGGGTWRRGGPERPPYPWKPGMEGPGLPGEEVPMESGIPPAKPVEEPPQGDLFGAKPTRPTEAETPTPEKVSPPTPEVPKKEASETEKRLAPGEYIPPAEEGDVGTEPDMSPDAPGKDRTGVAGEIIPSRGVYAKDVVASPKDMQFKLGADEKTGVVEPIEAEKYDPVAGGIFLLFEPKDGNKFIVANGHHRLELLQRLMREGKVDPNIQIPAYIMREVDGFTMEDARRKAAEANILDNKGTIYDHAEYFRFTEGIDEGAAKDRGLTKKGYRIGKFATDGTYSLFKDRKITPDAAEAISAGAPGDEEIQREGVKFVQENPKKDKEEIGMWVRARKALPEISTPQEQKDLFGKTDKANQTTSEYTDRAWAVRDALRERLNSIRGASLRPEIAAKEGLQAADPKALEEKRVFLNNEIKRWTEFWKHPDIMEKIKSAPKIEGMEAPTKAEKETLARATKTKELAQPKPKTSEEAQKRVDDYESELIKKYGEDAVLKAPVFPETYEKLKVSPPETKLSADELKKLRQLYKDRDKIDRKDLQDWFDTVTEETGLPKEQTEKALDALGINRRDLGVVFTAERLKNWGTETLDNLSRLYNHFTEGKKERTFGTFRWGGTAEDVTLQGAVADAERRPSQWDKDALDKTQKVFNAIARSQSQNEINLSKIPSSPMIEGEIPQKEDFKFLRSVGPRELNAQEVKALKAFGVSDPEITRLQKLAETNPEQFNKIMRSFAEETRARGEKKTVGKAEKMTQADMFAPKKAQGTLFSKEDVTPERRVELQNEFFRIGGMGKEAALAHLKTLPEDQLRELAIGNRQSGKGPRAKLEETLAHYADRAYQNVNFGGAKGRFFSKTEEWPKGVEKVPGLEYLGVQKIPDMPDQHVFTESTSQSTFYTKDLSKNGLEAERDRVKAKFAESSKSIKGPGGEPFPRYGTAEAQMKRVQIEDAVNLEMANLKNAPEVVVLDSEAQLPKEARRSSAANIRGRYSRDTRKVYIMANKIRDVDEALEVFRHEAMGHYALDAMFTDPELMSFLKRVATSTGRSEMEKIGKKWGLDLSTEEGKANAAFERIALMAEEGKNPTMLQRFYALLRDAIYKLSGGKWAKDLSDEQIKSTLFKAQEHMRKGTSPNVEPTIFIEGKLHSVKDVAQNFPNLQSVAGDTAKKFKDEDIIPKAYQFKQGIGKTIESILHFAVPRHGVPPKILDLIMDRKGYMERKISEFMVNRVNQNMTKEFAAMPQEDLIKFIDNIKTGTPQDTPRLQEMDQFMRDLDKQIGEQYKKYKPDMNWIKDHFRILWKVIPGRTEEGFKHWLSRINLEGSKGYFKEMIYPTLSEGMKAGGIPFSYNPMELMEMHYRDALKYIATQEMWKGMKDIGARVFVRKGDQPPEGFARLNDKIARVFFPAQERDVNVQMYFPERTVDVQREGRKMGMVQSGEWFVEENAARILNNYLSRDYLRESPLGSGLMFWKNMSTAMELSLSPFHFAFETLEAVSSQFGLGLRKVWNQKKVQEGLADMLKAPLAAVEMAKIGGAAMKYFANPEEFLQSVKGKDFIQKYPGAAEYIDDLFGAGGKLGIHEDYRINSLNTFKENLKSKNYIGAAMRSIPALNEMMMKPLFETYIPRLKWGLFMKEFSNELSAKRADIDAGRTTRGELARSVWDFVENRFGEMNFDNLFWDRNFKTALQMLIRSVTWKMGNIRAYGNAVTGQSAELINALRQGRMPKLTQEMAWSWGLLATTSALAAATQYGFTGKQPEEWKDFMYPRINEQGDRISLPTYMRDLFHVTHSPIKYVTSSMSGWIGRLQEVLNNKDFYGVKVHDPEENVLNQRIDDMIHLVPMPFSFSTWQRMTEEGQGTARSITGFLGGTKAPYWIEKSPAQQLATEIAGEKLSTGGRSKGEYERYKLLKQRSKELLDAQRTGAPTKPITDSVLADVKSGKLLSSDVKKFQRRITKEPLEQTVGHLSLKESLRIWEKANPEEKKKIGPIIFRHFRSSRSPEERSNALPKMEEIRRELSR